MNGTLLTPLLSSPFGTMGLINPEVIIDPSFPLLSWVSLLVDAYSIEYISEMDRMRLSCDGTSS